MLKHPLYAHARACRGSEAHFLTPLTHSTNRLPFPRSQNANIFARARSEPYVSTLHGSYMLVQSIWSIGSPLGRSWWPLTLVYTLLSHLNLKYMTCTCSTQPFICHHLSRLLGLLGRSSNRKKRQPIKQPRADAQTSHFACTFT